MELFLYYSTFVGGTLQFVVQSSLWMLDCSRFLDNGGVSFPFKAAFGRPGELEQAYSGHKLRGTIGWPERGRTRLVVSGGPKKNSCSIPQVPYE